MNPADPTPADDEFSRLLAACDEALAAGHAVPTPPELAAPPELQARLRRARACLLRLERARRASADTPLPSDGATEITPLPIRALGRFEVRRELGRGGGGIVFLAFDPRLRREVAVKVPRPEAILTPELRRRFLREARAAAGLEHPNLVTVHEVGEDGPLCYLVSTYCRGPSLSSWLKQRRAPVPPRDAAALVATLADAVHFMHGRGIIHRDIKPGNVLLQVDKDTEPPPVSLSPPLPVSLSSAVPRLTDFGLARPVERDDFTTRTGTVLGTPAYMAPEQAAAAPGNAGPAADIYALGVILYECLTGRPPFQAATTMETMLQVIDREPVPVRQLRPQTALDLATVCHKCLQKEPHQRYASAGDLAADLRRWLGGEPVHARPVGRIEQTVKWVRRHPAAASVYGLLLLVAVVGGLGGGAAWLWHSSELARAQLEDEKRQSEAARVAAETAQARLRDVTYLHQTGLAYRDWQDADVSHAERLLANCPLAQRGWEWHYVKRLCHADRRTLPGHAGAVWTVAFSADGRRLAAGSGGTVTIWATDTGQALTVFRGHPGMVNSVAFLPDGLHAISTGIDGTARIWNTATGKEMRVLPHEGAVVGASLSADGNYLVTAIKSGTIQLWDLRTGQAVRRFAGLTGVVAGVALRPDGRWLAGHARPGAKGELIVWEVQTGKEVRRLQHPDWIYAVAFSPDGRRLAASTQDRLVRVWDCQSGRAVLTLSGHADRVTAVAYSRDGTRIATASQDQSVRIWDAATGQGITTYRGHTGSVGAVAFAPDGRTLASASEDGTVKLWDATADPRSLVRDGHTDSISSLRVSPDSAHIATAGSDGTVRIWDTGSREPPRVIKVPTRYAECVAYSADGTRMAYGGDKGWLEVWDSQTGQRAWGRAGHAASVQSIAFHRDGTLLASASGSFNAVQQLTAGEVKLWDARNGSEVQRLQGDTQGYSCVAFSGDGRRLVCGGGQNLAVWDLTTGQRAWSVVAHDDSVVEVACDGDGRRLATASFDRTVKVWDARSGALIFTYRGHIRRVTSVAFHPDGRRIACGGDDGTVRIVMVPSGDEALSLKGAIGPVHSVAFSPDGHRLVTGGWDRRLRVWDGRPLRDTPSASAGD